MRKALKISILGATGSVGDSLIRLLEQNPDKFQVQGLSANKKVAELAALSQRLNPKKLCVGEGLKKSLLPLIKDKAIKVCEGPAGLALLAQDTEIDLLFVLVSGQHGLEPLVAALENGTTVGLANKESLVLGGKLITELVRQHGGRIIPLDSEHNALYQCLRGEKISNVKRLILTASGGPFLNRPVDDFDKITPQQALNHPRWSMGAKISIDSATMMNKCLEIIEAYHLFQIHPERIAALIHPQSIVHGIVEQTNGGCLVAAGHPDMRLPLADCISEYRKIKSGVAFLDWTKLGALNFFAVDSKKFPTVNLSYKVLQLGEGAPAYLNGANQRLVEEFLNERISFNDIFKYLKKTIVKLQHLFKEPNKAPTAITRQNAISDALQADFYGQEFAKNAIFKN